MVEKVVEMSLPTHEQQWHFVCLDCNAKFFAPALYLRCPRCGQEIRASVKAVPPWRSRAARVTPPRNSPRSLSPVDDDALLRTLLFALRHAPEQFLLDLERGGWVDLNQIVVALRCEKREWSALAAHDIRKLAKGVGRGRLQIVGDSIRATYGHSATALDSFPLRSPPPILYHGTSRASVPSILEYGLRPMGRSRVHLTSNADYTGIVAEAKGDGGVVLRVQASEAATSGVRFANPIDCIWLVEFLPPRFIAEP
jgi:putative RNA 2'-phosphotransferase